MQSRRSVIHHVDDHRLGASVIISCNDVNRSPSLHSQVRVPSTMSTILKPPRSDTPIKLGRCDRGGLFKTPPTHTRETPKRFGKVVGEFRFPFADQELAGVISTFQEQVPFSSLEVFRIRHGNSSRIGDDANASSYTSSNSISDSTSVSSSACSYSTATRRSS